MKDARLERLYADVFPDKPLNGWELTKDGCESLHINSRILPVAVVGPMFWSDDGAKWYATFYFQEDTQHFETKDEAKAYAVAVCRMKL